eukprot:CAMPEP_0117419538 /NCGR_PEP_ID=MMETSP0758-20121206/1075_1 /TAXON_ID=63605 /ORGANISM="Percolomonas cosmopolitus, Strain AE-1 (ATCC 50343)" /LENGTH=231 /DNA_ID=CAMNT_0005200653 /DNA_START=828 /DNA_END=1520 /DNA_ORIENTATION=-
MVIKPDSVLRPKTGDIQISSQMTLLDTPRKEEVSVLAPWDRSKNKRHSNAQSISASQVSDLQPFRNEDLDMSFTDASDQSENPLLRIKVRSNRNSISSHFSEPSSSDDAYHSTNAYSPLERPNTTQNQRSVSTSQLDESKRRHSTSKMNHYEYDPIYEASQTDSVFDLGSLPDLSIHTKRPSLVKNLDEDVISSVPSQDPPPRLSPILAESTFEAETFHIQKKKPIGSFKP